MIDYGYYRDTFCGRYGEEIVPYLRRAYGLIKCCVLRSVSDSDIADSVCVQAEYMFGTDGYSEVRLGSFSAKAKDGGAVCREALILLDSEGLLYRGGMI